MKVCIKCGIEKEESCFEKCKTWLFRSCKECLKKRRKESVEAHRRKSSSEYQKDYNMRHPERYILSHIKSNAKIKGTEFSLTIEDIVIPEYCPILGVKLSPTGSSKHDLYAPSVDRIDNSKGYIKGNIQIVSRKANIMKNCATNEELLRFSQYFNNLLNN